MSSAISAGSTPSIRLTSLDQFRGYTMFGMLLVNFLGGYKAVCPYILRHHHDYCSYADTIMPQFLFAAGFAMRLSLGRRLEAGGKMPWGRAIRRILGLALVAIAWYSFCDLSKIIQDFRTKPTGDVLFVLFKRELFQTLLHIAATSLWILPVIASSWKVRIWYAIASGILHVFISYWFNFEWVYSDPSGIDGGPLGLFTWAIPALCGTLACDAVRAQGPAAAFRIASCGAGVMLLGWLISFGTVLYNVPDVEVHDVEPSAAEVAVVANPVIGSTSPSANTTEGSTPPPVNQSAPAEPVVVATMARPEAPNPVKASTPPPTRSKLDPLKYAPDPVLPTLERLRSWDGTIVEPPFVPPPDSKHRRWNYWMMSQRGGTLSYPTFAAGVSLVIYALFLWLCDGLKLRLGFFRTLGTNSLAAYMLHEIAGWIVVPYFSHDTTSILFALAGFACFTLFVYGFCRLLERFGLYLRV